MIKINSFEEEKLKPKNNLFYDGTNANNNLFRKLSALKDLHSDLSIFSLASIGSFAAASSLYATKLSSSAILKNITGGSLLAALISLGSFYYLHKKENPDICKEISKCMDRYDKNSKYNPVSPFGIDGFAEYNNKINAYVKLIETNCSDEAINELKEKNLITDNIKSWIDGYKNNSNSKIGFLDYLKKENFSKSFLNTVLKSRYYGKSAVFNEYASKDKVWRQKVLTAYRHSSDLTNDLQDNKIGSFQQGSAGDCWFLSALLCVSDEYINNIISVDEDGNYVVKFKGTEEYINQYSPNLSNKESLINGIIVTEQELQENNGFSTGDKDVRILEIACDKLRKIARNESIRGGSGFEAAFLLTKKKPNFKRFNKSDIKETLNKLDSNKRYYLSSKSNIPDKIWNDKYPDHHAGILNSIDTKNEIVTVINPWNTYEKIKLTYYELEKYFDGIYL